MLLEDTNAIVYGAGGSLGGAVARALASEGARVFVTGRRLGPVKMLAEEIISAGGQAVAAEVDALDPEAVTDCVRASCVARGASGCPSTPSLSTIVKTSRSSSCR